MTTKALGVSNNRRLRYTAVIDNSIHFSFAILQYKWFGITNKRK
jgi:hypothetical protein